MRERVRARFFPTLPGAVLFFIPEGLKLDVQGLGGTFDREDLARACGDVQISEELPGRWTTPILRARSAAKAERNQRHKEQEATEAAVLRGSVDPNERDRAKLVLQKQEADARCRDLKNQITRAKTEAATRGVYMPPRQFRALELELESAKQRCQAIQAMLGQLREAQKAQNMLNHATFERAFLEAAREILHEEDLEDLNARAREILDGMEAEAEARQAAVAG